MKRVLACVACLAACLAYAQVYKWVDDKGVTHYTETPPPQDSKQLKVPMGQPVAAPEEKKDAPAAIDKGDTKDKAARCQFEKDQLKVMEGPVVRYKDAAGQMVELEAAKKEAAKKQIQENIQKYCS